MVEGNKHTHTHTFRVILEYILSNGYKIFLKGMKRTNKLSNFE